MITEKLYETKKKCCGCELCAQCCPMQIISMKADEEGFWYPEITDNSHCVECGLCLKVCPVRNIQEIHSSFTSAFAGWADDIGHLMTSSSGAAAAVLAEKFTERGGAVYGASYTEDFKAVEYIRAGSREELAKLKTSKYAQARKSGIVSNIRTDLSSGKKVLFTGLPCDCAGISRLLGKNENLYIVSLVCHGPTSPMVLEKFVRDLEDRYHSKIKNFSLRHKKDGLWKPYFIRAEFENGKEHMEDFENSSFNKAFKYFKRPSCNVCSFKKDRFAADLLIGDHHAAQRGTETFNEYGVSSLMVLSPKGNDLIDMISDDFHLFTTDIGMTSHQPAVNRPAEEWAFRKQFVSAVCYKGLDSACRLTSVGLQEKYEQLLYKARVKGSKIKNRIFH